MSLVTQTLWRSSLGDFGVFYDLDAAEELQEAEFYYLSSKQILDVHAARTRESRLTREWFYVTLQVMLQPLDRPAATCACRSS